MSPLRTQREEVERSLASGDVRKALELSQALLALDPVNADSLTLRAAALMAADKPDAAVDLLLATASVDASPRVLGTLAMCQVAADDLSAAVQTFRAALAKRPEDFVSRLAYAESLENLGKADEALPEYFRAVNAAQQQGRWLSDASTGPAMRERVKRAMDVIDAGRLDLFQRVLQPHINAFGPDSMTRVSKALQVYLGAQAESARDPRQRPKFFWMPDVPGTPLFGGGQFDWYPVLQAATPAIQEELGEVLEGSSKLEPFLQIDSKHAEEEYLAGDAQSRSWDAYFFYRHGKHFDETRATCPKTSSILALLPLTRIADHAPEVLFSVLAPQTHIKPHYGVTNTRVVTHLPLMIPQGDCRLVVGGVPHPWQEGRCVTFDDTFLHEAWNRTDQRRVVLILDTWNPHLAAEECIALKALVECIGDFNRRAHVQ
jgi:aspartate beta-hydroxylase